MDRLKDGTKQGLIMSVCTALVLTPAVLLSGPMLMRLFTPEKALIDLSMQMMYILAAGYIAMSVIHCLAGVMRGCGNTITPMWLAIIQLCVMRVPFSYLLCFLTRSSEYPNGKSEMIYVGLLLAFLIGCLMHVLVFVSGRWRKRIVKRETQ